MIYFIKKNIVDDKEESYCSFLPCYSRGGRNLFGKNSVIFIHITLNKIFIIHQI